MALLPQFIFKRFAGYDEEPPANAAGVSLDAITMNALGSLPYAPQIADDGMLSVSRYRWRRPYFTTDPWSSIWDELIDAGFAARDGELWFLAEDGKSLCADLHRQARRYLESLDVARMDLGPIAARLSAMVEAIPADSERTMCAHRGLPLQDEIRSDILRVDRAVSELWNFRDDSHIAAWQAEGYSGPSIDVVSKVWEGTVGLDEIAAELNFRQERDHVEYEIDRLVESGDLVRGGQSVSLTEQGRRRRETIERETDARYFRIWPRGDELARLGDDLSALVAGLP